MKKKSAKPIIAKLPNNQFGIVLKKKKKKNLNIGLSNHITSICTREKVYPHKI